MSLFISFPRKSETLVCTPSNVAIGYGMPDKVISYYISVWLLMGMGSKTTKW